LLQEHPRMRPPHRENGLNRGLRAILAPLACFPHWLLARARAACGGLRLVMYGPPVAR
jgi:hypothetical protein